MKKLFVLCSAFLLGSAIPSLGRDIYVNNLVGDDARDGSSENQALRTLKQAVALCRPGDCLQLMKTEVAYEESLVFSGKGGAPDAPIAIEGNGAVLSGLKPISPDKWEAREDGSLFFPLKFRHGALAPFLVSHGKRLPLVKSPDALKPGESCWRKEGIYFFPENGRPVAEYELQGTLLVSGFTVSNAGYFSVRNLTCEYFANDGFNIHGNCQGLIFENIVGRWNGDDGFSIHENVGSIVRGGHFHHNNYGIQDVTISRSAFYGVLVEDNRLTGIDLYGGLRSVVDSTVRNNRHGQICLRQSEVSYSRTFPENPLCSATAYLHNLRILGGTVGLQVLGKCKADISDSTIIGSEVGIHCLPAARVYASRVAILNCTQREVKNESDQSWFEANLYFPGRISHGGSDYPGAKFAEYQKTVDYDASSLVSPPVFGKRDAFRIAQPSVVFRKRSRAPGVVYDPPTVAGQEIRNPLASEDSVRAKKDGESFAFESVNPWCRVFVEPGKVAAERGVKHTSTLSAEQAVSGEKSMRLEVEFPPAPPRSWMIKLFSVKFSWDRPVKELRFQMYGDKSGMSYRPRIRDRNGIPFYGPNQKVDWEGWREIVWNLAEIPPKSAAGKILQAKQECPPLEVVVELFPNIPETGGKVLFYFDDLRIKFAGE